MNKVEIAFNYVKEYFPTLSIVIYNRDGLWCYMDENFDAFNFEGKINDMSLLEDAVDSLKQTPFIYQVKEKYYYEIHVVGKNGFSTAIITDIPMDDDDIILAAYENDILHDDDCHHVDYVNELTFEEWDEQFNY